jgi:hypothetical protein
MNGYRALEDWSDWSADQVQRFSRCCQAAPEVFVAPGAEHTGLDIVVKCPTCGREAYVETGNPREDVATLIQFWRDPQ